MERAPIPIPTPQPAIDGWLFLFCLLLTVLLPFQSLYQVVWHIFPALLNAHDPKRTALLLVYLTLYLSLGVYSCMTGLRLWMIKPGAVKFAKRFLLTFLLMHLAYFVFWFLLYRPRPSSLARMAWYHVAAPLPFFFLWTAYLEHSKRVRATYR